MHALSPVLTLQGAVAHVDMPVETGPTLYLPYSQKYPSGYVACDARHSRRTSSEHHVQLPLAKGDAVFFNPALFHGAGTNRTTDVRRMANLLQVSSAFGRAMETVDTRCDVPGRASRCSGAGWPKGATQRDVAPTSWPLLPRATRSRPTSTATSRSAGWRRPARPTCCAQALAEGWDDAAFAAELDAQTDRRRSLAG